MSIQKMTVRNQSAIGKRTLAYVVKEAKAVAYEAFEWSDQTWAAKAGIHPVTVYRITNGITRFPHFETICRMLSAVHLEIVTADAGSLRLRIKGEAAKDYPKKKAKQLVGAT